MAAPSLSFPFLESFSCAIFDCDGVLLDSNAVKVEAFERTLVDEDPDLVAAFIDEHRRTGGVSRYAKLRRFYTELATVAEPELAIESALRRFSAACREGLRACQPVAGARELIAALVARRVPLHVVSGGDQDEVREALEHHGLAERFAGIHGSPTPKREHLERLRADGDLLPGGVYLGDARLDMELAEAFGLSFIFVAGVSDWPEGREVARARGHRVVEDLR
ncbi:hydrolase, haloacid dehalogenase-like family protein [Plesiocystis pacifica SIR-1]|uniref:phosphoglycolate phosphatase n=1 Tax=Plesiocystis pacifica SIR-1 TaxID=391625 RepID=A6FWW9_9BACT|nr:HAD hydrolase-like protein [Plesiocystis pacifica]EDM81793.1 hydrolase, haloacid dehalogenase-like family protein [Plesiocystis pacifica SIR-1]